jgi:RHS repeat-associated protein
MTDSWESTSHVLGYFHGLASYAANGALASIGGVPGYTAITYGIDGEGRLNTAAQGTTNLVTGVAYTSSSQAQTVSLGTGDSDSYGYDSNTGRMTNYTLTVGITPKSQIGNLTWNANGTLRTLAITDGFNSGAQTCNFGTSTVMGYDDLGRLLKADCGSAWSQTFSYDPFGNITKTGSSQWMPGYNSSTNHAMPPFTYDNNGNMTYDTFHTYGWYVDNKLGSTDSTTCNIFGSTDGTCILYDAFGREVERGVNGAYTEVMYTPAGKTAIMNSQTSTLNAYFSLPGGATYDQTGTANGSGYFWHKDWLGSVRLSSSVQGRTFYFDRAFAPFGEMYDNFGNTTGLDFTGDTQDSFAGLLFDTPNRELHPGQGRWMSPDPAGSGIVNPGNPQSWNRYAYVLNNPLAAIDLLGLDCVTVNDDGSTNPPTPGDCNPTADNQFYFDGKVDPNSVAVDPNSGNVWASVNGSDLMCSGDCPVDSATVNGGLDPTDTTNFLGGCGPMDGCPPPPTPVPCQFNATHMSYCVAIGKVSPANNNKQQTLQRKQVCTHLKAQAQALSSQTGNWAAFKAGAGATLVGEGAVGIAGCAFGAVLANGPGCIGGAFGAWGNPEIQAGVAFVAFYEAGTHMGEVEAAANTAWEVYGAVCQ